MIDSLLGSKIGMTRVFLPSGRVVPVTVLQVGPCTITQVKTKDNDGYVAFQLGFGDTRKLNKPEKGHLKTLPQVKHLREFRIEDASEIEVGQRYDASVFNTGDRVAVTSISKGKGFAGVVKRHGFAGGPKTHGQSDRHRAAGSVGAGTTPGHVFKGTRMAGHMGSRRVCVGGLEVVESDPERGLLLIRGAVPGAVGSLVSISRQGGK